MDFSLLTYNTLYGDAVVGLKKICDSQHPDIICLQEIATTNQTFGKIEQLGYKLADYSNAFIKFGRIYGVATFYNPEKFSFHESKVIFLQRGVMEIIAYLLRIFKTGNKPRTVLKTEFVCRKMQKKIAIYNIHLSAYGTNSIRLKQIHTTLDDVKLADSAIPTILTGDFNYPYGRKKLEALMGEYDMKEATNAIFFTTEGALKHYTFMEKIFAKILFRFFHHRLKLDYIFFKNCVSLFAKKVDVQYSDHYPVYAVFKLNETQNNKIQ
jgi:endonuclease/exonuclease/phosphatase family metal-dependent hydrolase